MGIKIPISEIGTPEFSIIPSPGIKIIKPEGLGDTRGKSKERRII